MRGLALITGVSRVEGLGFAVARTMARHGFEVVITARDVDQARGLAAILTRESLPVSAEQLDVTDDRSVRACVTAVERRAPVLDVLVNNAAGGFDLGQSVLDADLALARLALEVNVLGPWRVGQAFLPMLRRGPAGRIVNVSSEAGSSPGLVDPDVGAGIPGYSVSKGALNALTIKLAYALRDTGVLVNAVCPGGTATHPELGDMPGARSPMASAEGVVWAATLPPGGPTGGFFRDGLPLPW